MLSLYPYYSTVLKKINIKLEHLLNRGAFLVQGGMFMTVEVALIFAGLSCLCAFLGYQKGMKKDVSEASKDDGELKADVKYIRSGIEDIKVDLKVQEQKIVQITERVTRLEERSKSNTHRLDTLEGK